jgi:RNA polymerase sigma-70 factor (ECF subfamily)
MVEHPSERKWILAARRGDDEAFACLVEVYQRPVFNLCYRMLGDPAEAEDASQEAFMKAYRALKRYDPDRKFVNWLLSIASNHSIDRLRKRRLKTTSLDDLLPGQMKPDPNPGPESMLSMDEGRQSVREMLETLSEMDRAAIVMRYWYDMSYEEIAESLDLTVSAVKSRLHRARRDMAREFSQLPAMAFASGG